MKILLITEFFPSGKGLNFSGGVEARTYFVGRILAKKNNVHVICKHLPNTKKEENINGIMVHRVGLAQSYSAGAQKNPLRTISFMYDAYKKGLEIEPDIVDGGNFLAHTVAKVISLKLKIPVVFWYPDVFLGQWIKTSGLIPGVFGSILERTNLRLNADMFLAISNITRNKLIKCGVNKNKIVTIRCGVDKHEFKLHVTKDKTKTILAVSRLVSYKRIRDLIWAFAVLSKKYRNLRLTIVGVGPELNTLQKLTSMLKLDLTVKFVPTLPRMDLIKQYRKAHIFCLPSEVEGFGISVIEANAAGVPYVVSDIPVFKEITKNGKGGFFFKLGSVPDLSKKLEYLMSNQTHRRKVVEGKFLYKEYDWNTIGIETEKTYRKLLN